MGYVTYDLKQQEDAHEPLVSHHVEEVHLPDQPASWEVGVFEHPSGKKAYGVRFDYTTPPEAGSWEATHEEPSVTSIRSKIVEIPANAENVQFYEDHLPEEYQEAHRDKLRSAS